MAKNEGKVVNLQDKMIQRFIDKRRPPEELRDQVDLSYRFQNRELVIFELRPSWRKKEEKMEIPIAKSTYIKSKGHWRMYWKRANGNWDPYEPQRLAENLEEVLTIIDEDEYSCFWG